MNFILFSYSCFAFFLIFQSSDYITFAEDCEPEDGKKCGCSTSRPENSATRPLDGVESSQGDSPDNLGEQTEDAMRTNTMVLIEGATFTMGTDKPVFIADGEGPAREVNVNSFWMDVHEVSNAEFKLFVDATGYITEVSVLNLLILIEKYSSLCCSYNIVRSSKKFKELHSICMNHHHLNVHFFSKIMDGRFPNSNSIR